MQVDVQKKIAAKILKVGVSRVWIDPSQLDRVSTAITRENVRSLIKEGVIKKLPEEGVSKGRHRKIAKQKRKGLRKGPGSRKGPVVDEKLLWMNKIRAIRKFLKTLRKRKVITPRVYRQLYKMAKGGVFDSVRQVKTYIKEHELARR
ncbi:MAG: 50S ribosomal protein L19e [Thermoprotei archaeon]|nr:MAG: 50S ribosomal protein L19e [Thermoprotei archaeon]